MSQPDWAMLLSKSKENLEVAMILYEKGSYGLAAYHLQQSIETLFKSFVYQILRKYQEYDKVKLYAHLPLIDTIGFISNFVEKIERQVEERNRGSRRQGQLRKDLKGIVARSEAMKAIFYKVKAIISKLENGRNTDHILKADVWKYSMGLPIKDDSELNDIISAAKEYGAEQSQDRFMEDMIYLAQVVFSDIGSFTRTDNDKAYFSEIKPVMSNFLTAEGFPSDTLTKMLDGKAIDGSDRAQLKDFVIAKGGLRVLSIFFSETGLLNAVLEVAKRYYPKTYNITAKYFDLQRVMYAVWICATLILLFPHESYGRYPSNIADSTTESIYSEKAANLQQFIEDCKKAYDQVNALM